MNFFRWMQLGLAVCSGLLSISVAAAEPSLPTGLEEKHQSEPALPSGIEDKYGVDKEWIDESGNGDAEWSSEEDWGFREVEQANQNSSPVTGFWELRLGHRLSSVDDERETSLGETRVELSKDMHWQEGGAKITGDFLYDAVEDHRRLNIESGEGWLDLREAWATQRLGDRLDVKVGRQILTWGVGDLIFINDLFPKDWKSFLLGRDEQYLKAPSDALRAGWYGEWFNLNVVYSPRFDSDRYINGRRLFYFNPLYGQVVGQNAVLITDKPDRVGKDDELALRLYRSLGSYEVALYGYHGYWKSPAGFNPATGEAIFPRLSVVGASARGPLGHGILSLETGYYDSRDDGNGRDPFVNNSEMRVLAGYERELMTDTTLGLQYYVEVLQDYDHYRDSLFPGQPERDEYRQLITARFTKLALNQNLTLSLFVFYSYTDNDSYLRPKVNYKVSDHWMVEAGMNLFSGKEDYTFFGQFEDNSNVYGAVRFSF